MIGLKEWLEVQTSLLYKIQNVHFATKGEKRGMPELFERLLDCLFDTWCC
jgi:hypothetical protein